MNELDDTILEFLAELDTPDGKPVVINPRSIYENIVTLRGMTDRSPQTVSRRMARLAETGLLDINDSPGKQYYITEKGKSYLKGEIDANELKPEGE